MNEEDLKIIIKALSNELYANEIYHEILEIKKLNSRQRDILEILNKLLLTKNGINDKKIKILCESIEDDLMSGLALELKGGCKNEDNI